MSFGGVQGQQTKKFDEDGFVTFDFTSSLAAGETISAQTVTAAVYSGVDPAPGNLIAGAATVINSRIVRQLIAGSIAGVIGVVYELLCTADTSLGQRLQQSSYLAIVPNLT